jgi:hypothetical protein
MVYHSSIVRRRCGSLLCKRAQYMSRDNARVGRMPLQYTKLTVAFLWVVAAIVVGLAADVRSAGALMVLAAIGLLPPLVMMLLWNEPAESLAESIRQGRR